MMLLLGCSDRLQPNSYGQAGITPAVEGQIFSPENDIEFSSNAEEIELYDEINIYREDIGIDPLSLTNLISSLCREHSQAMADGEVEFGHDGFEQRFAELLENADISEVAENVAMTGNQNDPIEVILDNWLNSEGHRENIEGDYDYTGVGVVRSSDGYLYFTQMFVR
jgi:uncharacterized protein YkwD